MTSGRGDRETPPGSALSRLLGLRVDEAGADRVLAWFDPGPEHQQPWGLVHGGVYAAVVEEAASLGAYLAVRDRGLTAVGIAQACDFLRSHRQGRLDVVAEAVHQSRSQQLWQVLIRRTGGGPLVARGQLRLQNVDAPTG